MTARPIGVVPAEDVREDRFLVLVTTGVFAGAYALGSVLQAAYIYGKFVTGWSSVSVWSRAGANALGVLMLLAVLRLWRQHLRATRVELFCGVVLGAAGLSAVRAVAQLLLGVYPHPDLTTTPAELVSGFVIGSVSAAVGSWAMSIRRGQRRQARRAEQLAVERALAVQALEHEEVRVRRDVADGLHGSLQQRLVLLIAQVGEIAGRVRAGTATGRDADALDEVRGDLEALREQDVRDVSHLLYPDQVDVGLVPAVRSMLRRVPSSVAVRFDVDDAVRAADDPTSPVLTSTERLLAVRVVEEGVANALRHASPTSLTVELTLAGGMLMVAVTDDGHGLDTAGIEPSGTRRLAERLAVAGGRLELDGAPQGGARLVGRLPVVALERV